MKIDRYISELLYDHDCVIVMDLGGIIAHYHPASINKALNVINPPSKRLAFNASLKNNDGLLAHHISSREALNYADACQVIRDYVEDARKQMAEGKKLKIEKIGVLFYDKDKNLQFLPDQHANYLIESFGLTPVHAPVIKKDVPEKIHAEAEATENYRTPQNKPTRELRIFKWKVLEVVPAAAVLTFLLMVPPVLNQLNTNLGTLLPFSRMNEYVNELKGVEPAYKPFTYTYTSPFEVPPANYRAPESSPAETTNTPQVNPDPVMTNENPTPVATEPVMEAAISTPATSNDSPPAEISFSENSSAKFHIIGGSFRNIENAKKLVTELHAKGIDAGVIGQNKAGLYLVSLLSSDNFTQVSDALPEMKSSAISTAWIYRK